MVKTGKWYPTYQEQLILKRARDCTWSNRTGELQTIYEAPLKMDGEAYRLNIARMFDGMFYKAKCYVAEGVLKTSELSAGSMLLIDTNEAWLSRPKSRCRITFMSNQDERTVGDPVKGQASYYQARVQIEDQVFDWDSHTAFNDLCNQIEFSEGVGGVYFAIDTILLMDAPAVDGEFIW